MPDLPVPPDDDLLRRYLQGRLPPDELEAVARYLDAHPGAASSLNALAEDDTLVTALRSAAAGETGSVSPEMAAVMTRVTLLGEATPPTPADEAMPTATAAPAAPFDPAYAPTADPDEEPDPDPVADLLGRLAASDRPGDLGRLGGFRVVRVLGRGGMGAVFEADDPTLGRRLALKVMLPYLAARPRAKQRFLREAAAAARVEHDHIVPVYLIGEDAGVPFLAMPLLAGESLDDAMRDRRPLPADLVLRVGREAAEGLAAAHAAGLVHRDVKPANVWLERDAGGAFRRVRLLDFGLAKAVSDATAGADDLTLPGAVMGTPAYMAPEQARGLPVDARADLFSLGCVLYQMATGRRPFAGPDPLAVLSALANDTPPPAHTVNPDVPPALSALINRLLVKDPAGRPASARVVADELARIAADPGRPVAEPAAPARRRAGGRWWAVAAGAAFVGLLAAGAYYGKTVVRVLSNEGELVVEVDDPAVEVTVKQGEAVVRDTTKDRAFVLKAGSGEVLFRDPDTGAAALTRAFTIERGGKVVLRATAAELARRPKPPAPPEPPAIPEAVALGPVKGRPVAHSPPPDRSAPMLMAFAPGAARWNPAGAAPPPAGLFPGEVVYADTFDGPERNGLPVQDKAQVRSRFEGGVWACEFPPADRPRATQVDFGPNPQDVAFVLRARATDVMFGVRFRQLAGPDRKSCLAFLFERDGRWHLERTHLVKDQAGEWVFGPTDYLRMSDAPDPDLASGKWFTLAVRSTGPDTAVWVNGRPLATATEQTPPPADLAPAARGFSAGVNFVTDGRCGFDLDHLTMWKLPPAAPGRSDGPAGRPLARADKSDGWIAVSPDGALLAVPRAGDAPDVLVLDAATGAVRQTLPAGSGHRAMRAAFTPDGRRLVTADTDANEAAVWDLATGRPVHRLPLEARAVAVAVRPDGKQVAVGGHGRVRLFDLDTGSLVRELAHGASHHHALAYNPAGDRLATGAQDERTVKVWDPDTGAEVRRFEGLSGPPIGVAFSPDGRRLAAGGDLGFWVWEVASGVEVLASPVSACWVGFGPDGGLWTGPWGTFAAGRDYRPRRWDVGTKTAALLGTPAVGGWASFALTTGGPLFVADGRGGVWACDPRTGRPKGRPAVAPPPRPVR